MSDEIKVYEIGIDELLPDPANANAGTTRGKQMIDASIAETGLHRGVAVDRNGLLVAGNKTKNAAKAAGYKKALVVETDGDTLVVTKRRDFDLLDADPNNKARRAAFFDNRTSETDLAWSAEQVLADLQSGVDFAGLFDKDELDALLARLKEPDWQDGFSGLPNEDRQPFQQMTFTLHDTQAEQVKEAIAIAAKLGNFVDSPNQNSNGNALAFICETFITEHGQS